jgi:hypothetical protein
MSRIEDLDGQPRKRKGIMKMLYAIALALALIGLAAVLFAPR